MKNPAKLADHLNKVDDNYTVTICHNGFLVDVYGVDSNEERVSAKYIVKTLEELHEVVQDLAWLPRT